MAALLASIHLLVALGFVGAHGVFYVQTWLASRSVAEAIEAQAKEAAQRTAAAKPDDQMRESFSQLGQAMGGVTAAGLLEVAKHARAVEFFLTSIWASVAGLILLVALRD